MLVGLTPKTFARLQTVMSVKPTSTVEHRVAVARVLDLLNGSSTEVTK